MSVTFARRRRGPSPEPRVSRQLYAQGAFALSGCSSSSTSSPSTGGRRSSPPAASPHRSRSTSPRSTSSRSSSPGVRRPNTDPLPLQFESCGYDGRRWSTHAPAGCGDRASPPRGPSATPLGRIDGAADSSAPRDGRAPSSGRRLLYDHPVASPHDRGAKLRARSRYLALLDAIRRTAPASMRRRPGGRAARIRRRRGRRRRADGDRNHRPAAARAEGDGALGGRESLHVVHALGPPKAARGPHTIEDKSRPRTRRDSRRPDAREASGAAAGVLLLGRHAPRRVPSLSAMAMVRARFAAASALRIFMEPNLSSDPPFPPRGLAPNPPPPPPRCGAPRRVAPPAPPPPPSPRAAPLLSPPPPPSRAP